MINDLDDTLHELLVRAVPIDPLAVNITFTMPGKDWAAAIAKPTLNLFLYDIRENAELRSSERHVARTGATGIETYPPARVNLAYLVSAWTTDIGDEHKLLGDVLRALLSRPVIPPEVLKGAMIAQPYPLRAWIAQHERTPNVWDFWGGLDGRLKAALSYVVTMAVETVAPVEVNLVTEKVLKLQLSAEEAAVAKVEIIRRRVSMCGHVRDAVSGAAVPAALVELLRRNLSARADTDGFYSFMDLNAGLYDLRVSAPQSGGRYGTASVADVAVANDAAGRAVLDPRANVVLPPTGVAGRASDKTTGAPLAEATARLRGGEATARTGADGRYRLSPLPPGNPTLEMLARGYAPETLKLSLRAGQELSADLALTKL